MADGQGEQGRHHRDDHQHPGGDRGKGSVLRFEAGGAADRPGRRAGEPALGGEKGEGARRQEQQPPQRACRKHIRQRAQQLHRTSFKRRGEYLSCRDKAGAMLL